MRHLAICVAAFAAFTLPAFAQDDGTATANVIDLTGKEIGTLTFSETADGVHITGLLTGLPAGDHGIHIHEKGECDATGKFDSAGAHFNPTSHKHGTQNPEGPHAGDLENISVTAAGDPVDVDLMAANVTLGEGENSLLDDDGSAIVIHADPDDYKTDPAGNSGDRIACGVIEGAAGE